MKRKQLQALCKKHGVPANSTNREMADRLTLLLEVPLTLNPYFYLFTFLQLFFGYQESRGKYERKLNPIGPNCCVRISDIISPFNITIDVIL